MQNFLVPHFNIAIDTVKKLSSYMDHFYRDVFVVCLSGFFSLGIWPGKIGDSKEAPPKWFADHVITITTVFD